MPEIRSSYIKFEPDQVYAVGNIDTYHLLGVPQPFISSFKAGINTLLA